MSIDIRRPRTSDQGPPHFQGPPSLSLLLSIVRSRGQGHCIPHCYSAPLVFNQQPTLQQTLAIKSESVEIDGFIKRKSKTATRSCNATKQYEITARANITATSINNLMVRQARRQPEVVMPQTIRNYCTRKYDINQC